MAAHIVPIQVCGRNPNFLIPNPQEKEEGIITIGSPVHCHHIVWMQLDGVGREYSAMMYIQF